MRYGDITSETEGVILHQVNCQGVMSSGVALAIKQKCPEVYQTYKRWCNVLQPKDLLGKIQVVSVNKTLDIVNIFGQLNYGKDGQRYTSYDALDTAFAKLANIYDDCGKIYTFNFPYLGCGLGGGDWSIVSAIIERHLSYHNLYLWDNSGQYNTER